MKEYEFLHDGSFELNIIDLLNDFRQEFDIKETLDSRFIYDYIDKKYGSSEEILNYLIHDFAKVQSSYEGCGPKKSNTSGHICINYMIKTVRDSISLMHLIDYLINVDREDYPDNTFKYFIKTEQGIYISKNKFDIPGIEITEFKDVMVGLCSPYEECNFPGIDIAVTENNINYESDDNKFISGVFISPYHGCTLFTTPQEVKYIFIKINQ